jgi:hypothetical protein
MASTIVPEASEDAHVDAPVNIWAVVASFSGFVGAWRLMGVCRASRQGSKRHLRTLPGLVMCGGYNTTKKKASAAVWRLNMCDLRWEQIATLARARAEHACCTVRGNVVVLGGETEVGMQSTVEVVKLDPLTGKYVVSALPRMWVPSGYGAVALAVDESESAEGEVLYLGGFSSEDDEPVSRRGELYKVDLATGRMTPQRGSLQSRQHFAAARLPDGRVVCVGGTIRVEVEDSDKDDEDEISAMNAVAATAEVLEPAQGSQSELWRWRVLPNMKAARVCSSGCVLSDGRFAIFGGENKIGTQRRSCEVLTLAGGLERWDPLPPMRQARSEHAAELVGGCVIVAGGKYSTTAEVLEDGVGRWRQLPCTFPHNYQYFYMGSSLM